MAVKENLEYYTNATLDADDMTITEYIDDRVSTYSIQEIIERWHGIPNVVLMISTSSSFGDHNAERRVVSRSLQRVGSRLNNSHMKYTDFSVPNKRHIHTVPLKEKIRLMEETYES